MRILMASHATVELNEVSILNGTASGLVSWLMAIGASYFSVLARQGKLCLCMREVRWILPARLRVAVQTRTACKLAGVNVFVA